MYLLLFILGRIFLKILPNINKRVSAVPAILTLHLTILFHYKILSRGIFIWWDALLQCHRMITKTKSDHATLTNMQFYWETSIIVLPSKVRVSTFLACFKRVFSFVTVATLTNGSRRVTPCNITLNTLPFSYHKVRSKQSHIVTNHKTNDTKLEHRINVATSFLISKVRASIYFSVSSFQTIRRVKFAPYRCARMSAGKGEVQAVNRNLLRRLFFLF